MNRDVRWRSWFPSYPLAPRDAQGENKGRLRLFCIPYAGAGASVYRNWIGLLSPSVLVCPVQLPGREDRYSEPPRDSIADVAEALARAIATVDEPYALFGYSMGALVAFEAARAARRHGFRMPQAMIVAAHQAPQLPIARRPIWNLPDPQFLAELRVMGGMSEEVFDHSELLEFLMPILRSDFAACDQYLYRPEAPLDVPLAAIGGEQDPHVPQPTLDAWALQSSARCSTHLLPGGHFFLRENRDLLIGFVAEFLGELASPLGTANRNHAAQGL